MKITKLINSMCFALISISLYLVGNRHEIQPIDILPDQAFALNILQFKS